MSDGFHVVMKRARLNAGLKQNELARRLGVSGAYMAKLEKGGNRPSPEFVARLAELLELDPVPLFLLSLEESRLPAGLMDAVRRLREEYEWMREDARIPVMIRDMMELDIVVRDEMVDIISRILRLFTAREKTGNQEGNPLE